MIKRIYVLLLILMLAVTGCSPTEKITGKTGDVTDVTGKDLPAAADIQDPNLKTEEFVVYRVPKNGEMRLVPEKVKYAVGKKSREEAALDALIYTDPVQKTLENLFPAGTKVLGVKVKDGIAYVDFNKKFAEKGQGSYSEMMMINAVVCTLTELPGIKEVKFLIEGKDIETISGHMDLLDPLTRNPELLKNTGAK